ncbi:MAG: DNA methyltransferase [Candidatus Paceibacterota bacterium]|jgi:DNA modification methylase
MKGNIDYFNMNINKIINGSCIEVMRQFPDKSIDVIITDPPYGVGMEYDIYEDTKENLKSLVDAFFIEAHRITDLIVITPGNENQSIYPQPTWTLAWIIDAGVGRCKWGFSCWQPVLVYGKDPYLKNGMGARADIIKDNSKSSSKEHVCAKPLTFMQKLIDRVSVNKDDLILDPFCGSGTTCVACKIMGRRYIGIDMSENYCKVAEERLGYTGTQYELF